MEDQENQSLSGNSQIGGIHYYIKTEYKELAELKIKELGFNSMSQLNRYALIHFLKQTTFDEQILPAIKDFLSKQEKDSAKLGK